jgi:hypothetical protein
MIQKVQTCRADYPDPATPIALNLTPRNLPLSFPSSFFPWRVRAIHAFVIERPLDQATFEKTVDVNCASPQYEALAQTATPTWETVCS